MSARPGSSRSVIRNIRDVIETEARTLLKVASSIDRRFAQAVELILRYRGKLIVTGVGKSGLIAQKVAATLTSTGTPAFFLHPADARHGSLGTIQRRDIVIAFAKSGESAELNDLLPTLKRVGARLLAVVSNPRSTLARAADLTLFVPIDREACPLNLAPTSSTTAAMAVGDGLAVALMKRRSFQSHHFALCHPGGNLGKRLTLLVRDLMKSGEDNPVVGRNTLLREVLIEMTSKHCGCVSVTDSQGRFLGLVTDYDLRAAFETLEQPMKTRAREVMNRTPTVTHPDILAADAGQLMSNPNKPFNVLPVVHRRTLKLEGLLRLHEIRAAGL
ncbi:MAG: KpsF/GutQ family sugar-phosphate isomerase [Elusimicrobia bacterium]|nr:KpsF/GutQ family sugar-phosphate isomerase [Elusimicrobiota bacterium]